MKAIRWHAREDVRLDEIPEPPEPGPGQIKLRVLWCGICGTDIEEFRHGPTVIPVDQPQVLTGQKAPLVLGHEFCGDVVAIGHGVTKYAVGDRVAVEGTLYCGQCYWCARHQYNLCIHMANLGLGGDGGLAEYALAPAYACAPLPPGLDAVYGALAEPLSVAVRVVRRSRLQLGESAAIFGAGPIGLFVLQVLRVSGAQRVFVLEPDAERRAAARDFGATEAFDPQGVDVLKELRQLTGGIGTDVTFECAGLAQTAEQTINSVRRGGRAVMVGACPQIPLNIRIMVVRGEKEIIGSLSHVCDEDYTTAIQLFADGRIRGAEIVTRLNIDAAIPYGFSRRSDLPSALKILISPQS